MTLTRILSTFFFLVALGLGAFLIYRINFKIDEDQRIRRQEALVINKLKLIRDAEVAFQAVNGKYTADWDSLIAFCDTGSIYLTQRTEEIIMKEYGGEDVIVTIDTLGFVKVKDSILVEKNTIVAPSDGAVISVNVKTGDQVKAGAILAEIQRSNGRKVGLVSDKPGVVSALFKSVGDQVSKEDMVLTVSTERIADINTLPLIPVTKKNEEPKKFELFAGTIVKGNVEVDVFEVVDVDPINPARRKNDNEKALRVGSRTDVSSAGNWE